MEAYRRVYDSRVLQADCQEPESAPEPYARQSNMGYLYLFLHKRKLLLFVWHREAEKKDHCSFMNKSFNMQRNLSLNIVIDVTYLISEIYSNFHKLLCKKVWRRILRHHVINFMITG